MSKQMNVDIETTKKLIRAEIEDVGELIENAMNAELAQVQAACHAMQRNILRLQAQISAVNDAIIGKGLVSRGELYRRHGEEMERLVKMSTAPKEQAAQAARNEAKLDRAAVTQ